METKIDKVAEEIVRRKPWETLRSSRHKDDLVIAFDYAYMKPESIDIKVSTLAASPSSAELLKKTFGADEVMDARITPCEGIPDDIVVAAGIHKDSGKFECGVVKLTDGKRINFSCRNEDRHHKIKHSGDRAEMQKFLDQFEPEVIEYYGLGFPDAQPTV